MTLLAKRVQTVVTHQHGHGHHHHHQKEHHSGNHHYSPIGSHQAADHHQPHESYREVPSEWSSSSPGSGSTSAAGETANVPATIPVECLCGFS